MPKTIDPGLVTRLAAEVQSIPLGSSRTVDGFLVERLADGAFRVGDYTSPAASRTRPAGVPVARTAEHLAALLA